MRPLYFLLVFTVYKLLNSLLGVTLEVFFDIILPLMGLLALVITVYYVGGAKAAFFASLYWSPAFIYGGFQTNLLALPLAILYAKYFIESKSLRATALGILLSLLHPWTLAYYTISLAVALKAINLQAPLKHYVQLIAPWASFVAVNLVVGSASGEGAGSRLMASATSIIMPLNPGLDLVGALLIQVWGTMGRVEAQLVFIIAALRSLMSAPGFRVNNWWLLCSVPGVAALLIVNEVGAYRGLLEAPLPLLVSSLRNLELLPLSIIALSTWLYMITHSAPI